MSNKPVVTVIGAGPAGLFAAQNLSANDVNVVLLNRDIKPGGLAEYGIFFDKYKMKNGLRKQFRKVLQEPNVTYLGNVTIGNSGDLTLAQIRRMSDAVLVTVGAQGTKWLGMQGEKLPRVYHAKDVVYHYNHLPPWSEQAYPFGKKVAIVGAGNVMLDIANYAINHLKVDEVIATVRRDPSAVKFTKKELGLMFYNLDIEALDAEIERTRLVMESVNVDVRAAREFIVSAEKRAQPKVSDTRLRFEFLSKIVHIVGNHTDGVQGVVLEDTTLQLRDDGKTTRSVSRGTTRYMEVDTVVFAVGDQVDNSFGLPTTEWGEFYKHPRPRHAVDGVSYEAFDPKTSEGVEGVFLAGWARQASTGLVGAARKDGMSGGDAILDYLDTVDTNADLDTLLTTIKQVQSRTITQSMITRLEQVEQERATANDLPEHKFDSNLEMLSALSDTGSA